MQCVKPVRLDIGTVPCGKCLACRIKKREEWSMRLLHEQYYWEDSVFVTLTYSDEHLPFNLIDDSHISTWPTLRKDHLIKFIKKLRRQCDGENKKIKFFACGEYGSTTFRSHYHLIIFGLGLDLESKIKIIKSWKYCDWSQPSIRKNSFGMAEPDSIRYVCQYIDKKLSGEKEIMEYYLRFREPPFRLLSNGMGERYSKDNRDQIESLKLITVKGKKVSIPRYYIKKLELNTESLKENAHWNDCENVEKLTGLNCTELQYCSTQGANNVKIYLEKKQKQKQNYINNTIARQNLKQSKL